MPQLDIVSYFPQFFWFCCFFTFFYIRLVQHVLPKITRVFAARRELSSLSASGSSLAVLDVEARKEDAKPEDVVIESLAVAKSHMLGHFLGTQRALALSTDALNAHTNNVFATALSKKSRMRRTVAQTLQLLHTVLPASSPTLSRRRLVQQLLLVKGLALVRK